MPLKVEKGALEGLLYLTPQRIADPRGSFIETYVRAAFAAVGIDAVFVQDNESLSRDRGTIRGLHFQLAPASQAKLVRVVAGAVFDVAVDLRAGGPTYGQWCGTTLTADSDTQIFIPIGFAHAYCTLEPNTIVAYKVDAFYDKATEGGLLWNDPEIGIAWPVSEAEAIVSVRDASLPRLRDAVTPFRFGR